MGVDAGGFELAHDGVSLMADIDRDCRILVFSQEAPGRPILGFLLRNRGRRRSGSSLLRLRSGRRRGLFLLLDLWVLLGVSNRSVK